MEFEYYFNGRKPSKAQVKKTVLAYLKLGYKKIEFFWGENSIEIERASNGQVYGYGWIKDISGQDMADEIYREGTA
jgi:hypothetical protein